MVIEQFLDPQFCQELIAQFPSFETGDARNEHGEVAGKSVNGDVARLGSAYERFDRLMRDSEFLSWVGGITGVPSPISIRNMCAAARTRTATARNSIRTSISIFIRALAGTAD